MGLVVITIQDEEDGQITLGFTLEPRIESETQPLSNAQVLGMMALHELMAELQEDQEDETSRLEG